jgi:hypothetical protein
MVLLPLPVLPVLVEFPLVGVVLRLLLVVRVRVGCQGRVELEFTIVIGRRLIPVVPDNVLWHDYTVGMVVTNVVLANVVVTVIVWLSAFVLVLISTQGEVLRPVGETIVVEVSAWSSVLIGVNHFDWVNSFFRIKSWYVGVCDRLHGIVSCRRSIWLCSCSCCFRSGLLFLVLLLQFLDWLMLARRLTNRCDWESEWSC